MNTPDNLSARVANLENLMVYMAQTQDKLSTNQQLLTAVVQKQEEEITLMREILQRQDQMLEKQDEMLKRHDETIVVMQGQIGLLLNKLLGNS